MHPERVKLSERLLNFSASVIKVARPFPRAAAESHIIRQIVRSVTSAGANYEEACSGESRADFLHKLQIALKELNETLYWLRLIEKIDRKGSSPERLSLIQENKELCAILARSVLTAKQRAGGLILNCTICSCTICNKIPSVYLGLRASYGNLTPYVTTFRGVLSGAI